MWADFFCRNTGIRKKNSSPHLLRCPSPLPRCCFWCCRTPRLCSGCLGSDWARGGPSGSAHAELTSEGSLAGRGIPWTGAQRGAQTDPTCTCERREGTHGVRLIMITEMLFLFLFVCWLLANEGFEKVEKVWCAKFNCICNYNQVSATLPCIHFMLTSSASNTWFTSLKLNTGENVKAFFRFLCLK